MKNPETFPSIANIQDALAIMASFDPHCTLRAEHDTIYGSELPDPDPDSYGAKRMRDYGWHYEDGIGWTKNL